ncbi:Fc.00g081140.m01.CDS01 [Cosmosporella sp. VM-42]
MIVSILSTLWTLGVLLRPVRASYGLTCSTWLLGEKFNEAYPHHHHIDTLWRDIWRPACVGQFYPFGDGDVRDFDPIFANLTIHNITTGYDPNYTLAFFSTAEGLVAKAEEAKHKRNEQLASELYLRAAAVLRISRFPILMSEVEKEAWELQKDAFFKGARYTTPPVKDLKIPHTHAANGDLDKISVVLRQTNLAGAQPVVLVVTGLDGYRTDMLDHTKFITDNGWHALVAEIPGTGDSPANKTDPTSPERLWSSLLDWAETQPQFDMTRFGVWGLSTGSYYGIRMAHTHAELLHAVAVQGSAVHKFLEPEWITHSDLSEYAFAISPALTYKWGYETVDDYKQNGMKTFSLVDNGILNMTSTQLLMVNGMDDGIFPAEDNLIPLDFNKPKLARLVLGQTHMGGPEGETMVKEWLQAVM